MCHSSGPHVQDKSSQVFIQHIEKQHELTQSDAQMCVSLWVHLCNDQQHLTNLCSELGRLVTFVETHRDLAASFFVCLFGFFFSGSEFFKENIC